MAKPSNKKGKKRILAPTFRIRPQANIGYADAKEDKKFLDQCFVDTGILDQLRDVESPKYLLVGRTGAGKTALLTRLNAVEDHSVLISPEQLAIHHIANTTILTHLKQIGVNLIPFYKLLWKQVLAEEFLRLVVKTKEEYEGIFQRIFDSRNIRGRKKKAAEYLKRWDQKFWEETDERVAEVITTIERNIKSSLGADFDILEAGFCSQDKAQEQRKKSSNRNAKESYPVNGFKHYTAYPSC